MLKVLHVIAHFEPGGTERQMYGVFRAAHGTYWDATLAVLNPGYPLAHQLSREGVALVELHQRYPRDVGRIRRLRSIIRDGDFDVVHSILWRGSMVARMAAAYRGRPAVVMSEQAVEWHRPLRERLIDRVLSHATDLYIGNSEAVAHFISSAHHVAPDRVVVVGNGIDATVFHPGLPRAPRQTALIGSVGRLTRQKGYDVLIEALAAILERRPAEVVIVGVGEEEGRLRSLAKGLPVTFAGWVGDHRAVADFLRELDLFVLPSRFEGLPNALLEARACGVPVVATSAPGNPEALPPGAPVVPPDDPTALADAILAALDGRFPAAPLDPFSFDDAARLHLEVFERALRRRLDV